MSRRSKPRRLLIHDEGEAFVLSAALQHSLAGDADLSVRARELLARWIAELGVHDVGLGQVLNLDGTEHESAVADRIFARWAERMEKPRSRLDSKRRRLIERRLLEGWSEPDLLQAIEGCAASTWHMGDNPDGRAFNGLDLILRDNAHIEGFIEMAERTPRRSAPASSSSGAAGRHQRTRAELEAFAKGRTE